jgi:NTE family protein
MGARQDRSGDRPRRPNGAAKEPEPGPGGRGMAETKTINLALQGGGAHGAFAWGVLDKLLEDGRICIEGISATSAGAMNAAVLAYGYAANGNEGARGALDGFWRRIAHAAVASPLQPSLLDRLTHNHGLSFNPAVQTLDLLARVFSPYQLNPLNLNPLQHILEHSVDFERLRASSPIKLFLSATNVRTGKVRVFTNAEITSDAVMASACLPFMFQAVEIDGEAYWDGGFMGNPAIFPLIYECTSCDVVVVHINPLARSDVPKTATEILNRVNEISFNSSLMREMRAVAFVTRLIDEGQVAPGTMKRMLIHSIAADDFMQSLGVNSKLNADWEFLTHLRDVGRAEAAAWLDANFQHLARQSTTDLGLYL